MLKKDLFFKTALFALSSLLFAGTALCSYAQGPGETLRVIVLEKSTDEPIPGVFIKHGRAVYSTDVSGTALLKSVSGGTVTLSLRAMGYREVSGKTFSYQAGKPLTIRLSPLVEMLGGVTVETIKRHSSLTQQVSTLSDKELESKTSVSVAKLLETLPGVSSISTGGTIAKPVIQGMYGSRILLINNGVKLESQSWGDDHAPEIDHTGANIVEVIKGAESIRYGYGAVGGVVLFNQAPLPFGHDRLFVRGKANLGYDTNARGYDGSATVEAGYKDFGIRLHGLYQRAGDYTTPKYVLNNTGFNNISFSGLFGWQGERLSASVYSSLYYSRMGIYYGSQISDVNQLLARFEKGRPEEETVRPFSYDLDPPFQQTQHFTLKGEVKWLITKMHHLSLKFSFQDNLRQEFENRKQLKYSLLPVQDLELRTYSGDLIWNGRWNLFDMATQAGVNGTYQYNYNFPGTKQPAFIPNYAALTLGAFVLQTAQIGKLQASAGMRYDFRAMDVNGYTSLLSYKYYNDFKLFFNFTANVAAHYEFNENWDARLNLGLAWRPPDVNELYSAGLNHGIYWGVGNKDLSAEQGFKGVLGARYRNSWVSVEPSLFYQRVNNYIYDALGQGTERFHNHPSGKYPQFVFEQDDARFFGGDLMAVVQPLQGLSVTGKGEWIAARNLTQDAWMPFMPSDRYTLQGAYERAFGKDDRWKASLSLEGIFVTKQTRFDPSKDLVAETPPAYFLLNCVAEAGYDFGSGRSVKLMLVGDNILNREYKEYTDRFRYYAHAMGARFSLRTLINF
ncbi:MAG: TonB-dependent receptor [Porphyromonas sp.]|nr:TonB-dependent receptor [Bacteroidales bacterium]MDY3100032.1 TonB-dependent receptor [Porphyromonas sp.]